MVCFIPVETLSAVLTETFNPDRRRREQAEQQIIQLRQQPFYLASLLQFITAVQGQGQTSLQLQQAAAIELKNGVRRAWKGPNDGRKNRREEENKGDYALTDAEKKMIKDNVIRILVSIAYEKQLLKLVGESVRYITREEYPKNWSELLPSVKDTLQVGEVKEAIAALVIIEILVKNSMTNLSDEFIGNVFPLLTTLVKNLTQAFNDSQEQWLVIGYLTKIYYHAVWYRLPQLLQEAEYASIWVVFLNQILIQPVNQQVYQNLYGEKRKLPQWVAKKYCVKSLYKLYERYGIKQYCDKESIPFATAFSERTGEEKQPPILTVLDSMFQMIELYRSKQYCSDLVLRFALFYVCKSCELSISFTVIKPKLREILDHVVLKLLAVSPKELETWATDEAQLIRDKFSFDYLISIGTDPHEAAGSFVEEVTSGRTRYVLPFVLNAINEQLDKNSINEIITKQAISEYKVYLDIVSEEAPNAADQFVHALRKSAALRALEEISKTLLNSPSISNEQLATMILSKVVPELESPFMFLRFYAVRCLCKYLTLQWPDEQKVLVFTTMMLRLLNDSDLPVRALAGISVANLVRSKNSVCLEIISTNLKDIIGKLLEISRTIVVEELYETLQVLVARFPQQVTPMAGTLLQSLTESFLGYYTEMENSDQGGDIENDVNDNELAALDCLSSMNELLISVGNQQAGAQHIRELVDIIFPCLSVIFFGLSTAKQIAAHQTEEALSNCLQFNTTVQENLDGIDYLQSALETMRLVTFYGKYVPKKLWRIIPYLFVEYKGWAIDYTQEFAGTIENMIHYDPSGFLTLTFTENSVLQMKNFDIVLKFAEFAISQETDEVPELDKCYVLSMLQVMVQTFKLNKATLPLPDGSFENVLKGFIEMALQQMEHAETQTFKVSLLVLVQSCIYYDPLFAMKVLGPERVLPFMEHWFLHLEFQYTLGEQLTSFFALTSLMTLGSEFLPQAQQLRKEMLTKLVFLSNSISQMKAKKKEAEEKANSKKDGGAESGQFGVPGVDDEDLTFGISHSTYPRDVPDHLDVLCLEFSNDLPEFQQDFEQLKQYLPESAKTSKTDYNAYENVANTFGPDGDDQEDTGDNSYLENTTSRNVLNGLSYIEDDFDVDEDDGIEEESPLEVVDERVFLFSAISGSESKVQQSFQDSLSTLVPEAQQAIEKLFLEGKQLSVRHP